MTTLALQAAAMLDRVLSESSKIPKLGSLIAQVIQADIERLVDGRLSGLSKETRVDFLRKEA